MIETTITKFQKFSKYIQLIIKNVHIFRTTLTTRKFVAKRFFSFNKKATITHQRN